MNLNKADKFKFVFKFLHNNFIDYFDTFGKSFKPQPNSRQPAVTLDACRTLEFYYVIDKEKHFVAFQLRDEGARSCKREVTN